MNRQIRSYQRIVIKIGSALLVDSESGLRRKWLASLIDDVAMLKRDGKDVLIVSSGAIALGRKTLSPEKASSQLKLSESQAAAAIGQIALSRAYSEIIGEHGLSSGQVLLTVGDTETRRRYLNARATVETLLAWNAIPVINENDTVATSEIRYGDNDRLAARVASMIGADLLVLLSDVDGLYTTSPENEGAEFISEVAEITAEIEAMAGDPVSNISRGGMKTKIEAAKIATAAGTTMVIGSGKVENPLRAIDSAAGTSAAGTSVDDGAVKSTWFAASANPINERKKWIAGGLGVLGSIKIDEGALVALESGKSLLPAGISEVRGDFRRGDTVNILGPNGHKVGRGLVQYDSDDANKIAGLKSDQIIRFLGPSIRPEMIHRDDMALDG